MSAMRLRPIVRVALAAAVLSLAIVVLAAAPFVRGDVEGSVPEATAFTTQRKLVRFSDGSLALAYVVQVNGTNRVQVARSPDGGAWAPLNPPGLDGPTADRPALAVDSRDRLHLAWTANATTSRQVFYASYEGSRWSAAEKVSETQGYSGFPSIAVDSRDRIHIAWYGFDGTYYQVYYRMRTSTGWGPQVAVTAESLDATNPALAVDGADVVHIVWYHINSRGTGFQVSYAELAGGSISIETISASEDALDPTMVVDRTGRVLVAWTTFGAAARIAYTEKEGGAWSSPVAATPAAISASHPSLTLDGAGNPYLFYQAADGPIYLQRRENATWSAPQPLSQGGNNTYPSARWSYYPLRAPAGPATVDVVWTQATASGYTVRFASVEGTPEVERSTVLFGTSDFLFFGGLLAAFAGLVIAGRRTRGQT